MMSIEVYRKTLLALVGSALLVFAAPSQALGLEKLEECLDEAKGDTHEVSQCYWRHFERQASFGR